MDTKCSFITKKNIECSRKNINLSKYCWQHTDNKETCTICLEKVGKHKKFIINCKHGFHKKCIAKWMKYSLSCPLCRYEVSSYELTILGIKKIDKYNNYEEYMYENLLTVLYIIDTLFDSFEE